MFNDEIVEPLQINANVYVKNKSEIQKDLEKKVNPPRNKKKVMEVIDIDTEEDEPKKPKKGAENKLETLEVTPEGYKHL